MQRILGLVVGLAALAFGIFSLIGYFNPSLPKCDGSDTQESIRKIVMQAAAGEPAVKAGDAAKIGESIKLSGFAEVSYDKDKDIRECTAVVDLAIGTDKVVDNEKIAYTVTWQNKDDRQFYVQFHPVKP